MKKKGYIVGVVLLCTVFAILFHAILPSDANAQAANSLLVEKLGFHMVVVLYFVILYIHCTYTILYFGNQCSLNPYEIALRFGLAYGMMYLVGMFEIVPSVEWDIHVGFNQFWVGLGDMVPVILLAFLVVRVLKDKKQITRQKLLTIQDVPLIMSIAIVNCVVRIIGYYSGIVASAVKEYTLPVISWTILFSIVLGIVVCLVKPILMKGKEIRKSTVMLTIGVNWFLFNSFMTLISKDMFTVIGIRVLIDVVGIYLVLYFWNRKRKVQLSCNI